MTDTECTCPTIAASLLGKATDNTCEIHSRPPTQADYVALNDADGLASLLGIPLEHERHQQIRDAMRGDHDH